MIIANVDMEYNAQREGYNESVAEERETTHAASSPAAIMKTGSRVYKNAVA